MRFGSKGINNDVFNNSGVSTPPPAPVSGEVISLAKGEAISLAKVAPGLKTAMVGLGWDPINEGMVGADFDLDASCFLLDENERAHGRQDFVFYGNLRGANDSVVHQGDNLTGGGDGDDEQIMIDFDKVPEHINKIVVAITIYEYDVRRQNFGMVHNSFVRVVDTSSDKEIIRFNLGEDFSAETAIIACEFYKYNGEWKMKARGQGYAGGLKALGQSFGLNLTNK